MFDKYLFSFEGLQRDAGDLDRGRVTEDDDPDPETGDQEDRGHANVRRNGSKEKRNERGGGKVFPLSRITM